VLSLINSRPAISELVAPCTTSCAMCASWDVRLARVSTVRFPECPQVACNSTRARYMSSSIPNLANNPWAATSRSQACRGRRWRRSHSP
jgi:hypothetical protein